MNEYIEHLKKEDSMMSSGLHQVLTANSEPSSKVCISIKTPDGVIDINNASTFSLCSEGCNIVFNTGTQMLRKIQKIMNQHCHVSFYDFKQELQLVAYTVDEIGSSRLVVTLKFTAG